MVSEVNQPLYPLLLGRILVVAQADEASSIHSQRIVQIPLSPLNAIYLVDLVAKLN